MSDAKRRRFASPLRVPRWVLETTLAAIVECLDVHSALCLLAAVSAVDRSRFLKRLQQGCAIARCGVRVRHERLITIGHQRRFGACPRYDMPIEMATTEAASALLASRVLRTQSCTVHLYNKLDAAQVDALWQIEHIVRFVAANIDLSVVKWNRRWNFTHFFALDCALRAVPPPVAAMSALLFLDVRRNHIESLDNVPALLTCRSIVVAKNCLRSLPVTLRHANNLVELDASYNCLEPSLLPTLNPAIKNFNLLGNDAITHFDDIAHTVSLVVRPIHLSVAGL